MSKDERVLDYSAHQVEASPDLLKQIIALADQQRVLEDELGELELKTKTKKKELEDVKVGQLPGLMKDAGLESFVMASGFTITITEGLHCSIPKARYEEAITWLDENGFEKLVKREFIINFNREDQAWAQKFKRDLGKRKKPLDCKEDHTVHPQTLKVQLRQILTEATLTVPFDLFGIFYRPESKLELTNKSKGKKKEEI